MTAEEYVVEKIKELENSLSISNDELEGLKNKLREYENLVDTLARRICVDQFGVVFEFKNYEKDCKKEIDDVLSEFFNVNEKES